jgi:hypothetical protein
MMRAMGMPRPGGVLVSSMQHWSQQTAGPVLPTEFCDFYLYLYMSLYLCISHCDTSQTRCSSCPWRHIQLVA